MAKMIGVSPTYRSQVERDEFLPQVEDKVRSIAGIIPSARGASLIWRWRCQNCRRSNWRCALPIRKAISFQRLQSIAC